MPEILFREKNAAYLKEKISKVPGIMAQEHYPGAPRLSHYNFDLRFDKAQFARITQEKLIKAVSAEGIPSIGSSTPHLNRKPYLEKALSSRGYQRIYSKERLDQYREQNVLPRNDELCVAHAVMGHQVLMGTKAGIDDIVEAFARVQKNTPQLNSKGAREGGVGRPQPASPRPNRDS